MSHLNDLIAPRGRIKSENVQAWVHIDRTPQTIGIGEKKLPSREIKISDESIKNLFLNVKIRGRSSRVVRVTTWSYEIK